MTFLHLSDLHLGKRVFEQSMLEEQRAALLQIAEIAEKNGIEVIDKEAAQRINELRKKK